MGYLKGTWKPKSTKKAVKKSYVTLFGNGIDGLHSGGKEFQSLEPETPMMRIFDKLTFAFGNEWRI